MLNSRHLPKRERRSGSENLHFIISGRVVKRPVEIRLPLARAIFRVSSLLAEFEAVFLNRARLLARVSRKWSGQTGNERHLHSRL